MHSSQPRAARTATSSRFFNTARRSWDAGKKPTSLLGVESLEARTLLDSGLGRLAGLGTDPGQFAAGLYGQLLHRAPDSGGLAYWQSQMAAGVASTDVAAGFLSSHEYATPQDLGWLEKVYQDVLGRPGDESGIAFWNTHLAQGASRTTVALGILHSPEAQILGGSVQVTGQVTGALVVQLRTALPDAPTRLFNITDTRDVQVDETGTPGLFRLTADEAILGQLRADLANQSFVEYIEAEKLLNIEQVPNDPSYGNLWGLGGTNGIQAPVAWDSGVGLTKVTVAVIDTGVDYNHPDLFKNIWLNQGEIPPAVRSRLTDTDGDTLITFWDLNDPINQGPGKITDVNANGRIDGGDALASVSRGGWADGVSNDGDSFVDDLLGWNFVNNTNNPMDDNSHGTHCAGTIGAIGNNGLGVAGVNWKTQIMALKFLGAGGSGSASAAGSALRYAVDHGAKVSSNSYGGGADSTLSNAISYANSRGHLFVAAAGNSGVNIDSSPSYPAAYTYSNVVSVAAMDINGNRASFSNFGPVGVDLGAPGVTILSTVPGTGYGNKSGTSMATPHVAGAVTLVWSQHLDWTSQQIKDQIMRTTTPSAALQGRTVTGGRLNLSEALSGAATVVDFGQSGYTETGSWTTFTSGFGGSLRYNTDADGTASANWQFSNLAPDTYRVQVTWLHDPNNRASNAAYAIYDGDTLLGTVSVNQRLAPTGLTVNGSTFQTLGSFPVASGTLRVVLTNAANGLVIADAARIVKTTVTPPPPGPPSFPAIVDNSGANYSDSGPGWFSYGAGYGGNLRAVGGGTGANVATWQLSNMPSGNYNVQVDWLADPNNRASNATYKVYDGPNLKGTVSVNQRISPSGTALDGVVFQSLGTFSFSSGTLRVELSDEANGTVIADAIRIVSVPPPNAPTLPAIVDNSNSGYSESGSGWFSFGAGYGGNLRAVVGGTGANVATWQLANMPSGNYNVQIDWLADPNNRASNATYKVYDGANLLGAVTINQRVSPVGTRVGGVTFQSLGRFTISSGTLRVELSDATNGTIVADAMRVTT